jgi:hypothetical protein
VGDGKRIPRAAVQRTPGRLTSSTGVLITRYVRDGAVRTGSFA